MDRTEAARVVIVGGGPAGYTAAIYAARAGLAPVCIEGYSSGGQIIRSPRVDNFPGYPAGVAGAELADQMRAQAQAFGARIVTANVVRVDLDGPPFLAVTSEGQHFSTEAMIVATGAEPRQLGLPSELEFEGRGVAYCAICDGAFFAGKRVAVVGGGNAAVEDALALADTAAHVVLIHRRTEFRAAAAVLQILHRSTVEVLAPAVVTEILGAKAGVTGVRVRHLDTDTSSDIALDGIFVAIGHDPSSEMFRPWLKTDGRGYLHTEPDTTATNVPGVFAAGDVADSKFRQAVTAAATGCQAAIEAERWLIARGAKRPGTLASAGPRPDRAQPDAPPAS